MKFQPQSWLQANSVDIIVFPEYGLTGFVKDPAEYAIEIPIINNGSVFQNYVSELYVYSKHITN